MPLISVVIPVYNAENYLKECLDSVINQTYTNLEIICINDGSTDNSLAILQAYSRLDNRIKVFTKENEGLIGKTLNFGLAQVSPQTKYIARMDADDICVPSRIEEQYQFMESNQDVDISGSAMFIFGKIRDKEIHYKDTTIIKERSIRPTLYDILKNSNDLSHPTVIFRASFLLGKNVRYSDTIKVEDKELWMRSAVEHSAKIANINKPLLYYRVIPTSWCHEAEGLKILKKEWAECSTKYLNIIKNRNPEEYYKIVEYELNLEVEKIV